MDRNVFDWEFGFGSLQGKGQSFGFEIVSDCGIKMFMGFVSMGTVI
jgi:hypothetical protein